LWVDGEALERLWRAQVLRLLVDRGKINDEVVQNLLSWRHSGFSVHAGVRVEQRRDAARLGRYMARCPIVLDRLEWDASSEEVVIHPRPSRRAGPFAKPERLDVLAFLARALDHVPEPRQQQVRYWGWYSNAARGKRHKAEAKSKPIPPSTAGEHQPKPSQNRLSWARLIRRIYSVDPLLCPYCGAEMKIVAFVVEPQSLRRLLRSLGVDPQQAEPLARAPPAETELRYEATWG
jgi:hypothetical protein